MTTVVYPALAEVPPGRWSLAHAAHSRRIAYVVAPVYSLLATASLRASDGARLAGAAVAAGGALAAVLTHGPDRG